MSKNKIKKPNLSVKKPSAKGALLKSLNRNSKPSPQPSPVKGEGGFLSLIWERIKVRVFNFKRWHKISAAFVSIAIIGIVVFYQDARFLV